MPNTQIKTMSGRTLEEVKAGIRMLFDALNGESESNEILAEMLVEQSRSLPFMNK